MDDSGLRLLLRTLSTAGRVNWINIGGLTPGKVYDFRMYYRPYGNSDRNFIHNFQTNGHVVASIAWNSNTDGGVTNSDPNITTGYSVVGCRYVAGSDGRMVLSTQKVNENDNNGYHIYAFTNEEVADGTGNVTLSPDADNAFNGEITGGASVTVSGTGVQTFGGGISTPLAVTGTVILDGGAAVTGGVTVAQGGVLEMRPGSMAGALTGAGTLRLAHGEGGLRGALQADGTFSAPAFPQRVFFTGDDDCGISSGKRYAHAWNFGTNTEWATIVNGAQFAPQIPRDTTPKDGRRFVNLSIPSCGGGVQDGSFIGGMNTTFADTEVLRILHGMCYGGQSNSFNFYGLEAGKDYEVRFYNRAWGSSSRQCIFTCNPFGDGDVQYDFNENDSATPSYVAFRFRPSGTMFSVVGSTRQSGDYPHFYAATVEEVKNYSRIVNADVDAEFSGAVMGNGALLKRGSGVQTLSGAVTATGPWTVEAGGLNLANASASVSNVAVMAGATFGGFGRVTGDVGVAAGGHLALGASGALHVGGNVVMASGSALDVAFNSDGTGTGSLSVVGTLAVPSDLTINLNGAAKPKTRDSLITASGGITGNTSGWVVKGASGKVISKAKIIVTGNKLTLSLDRGMVIILR